MQTKSHWQLQTPISAIIFDCDGTLSTLEGIDELAKINNVSAAVEILTQQAMSITGINASIYQERLKLVVPTATQVETLGKQYFANQVPDVSAVINLLTRLNKTIYLVSAGLYPAVKIFGELLKIPTENIHAVNITFDERGNYLDYERTSPLVNKHGKREVVNHLKHQHEQIGYVGDGLNDYEVYDLVTRFIGYGGVFYRENIEALCQYYIRHQSMSALLPLLLTEDEYQQLSSTEKELYHQGLQIIQTGMVTL